MIVDVSKGVILLLLALSMIFFSGCEDEEEGPTTSLVILAGSIEDPAYTTGDFILNITNSEGVVLVNKTLTGGNNIAFSEVLQPNAGDISVTAFGDSNGNSTFDPADERAGSIFLTITSGKITGKVITLENQVLLSGNITHPAYIGGNVQVVAEVSGETIASTLIPTGDPLSYMLYVPQNTGLIDIRAYNDHNVFTSTSNGMFDATYLEYYYEGLGVANIATMDVINNFALTLDVALAGTLQNPAGWEGGNTIFRVLDVLGNELKTETYVSPGTTLNFGLAFPVAPPPGMITLIAFNDVNLNGIQDASESAVSSNMGFAGTILNINLLFTSDIGDYGFEDSLGGWTGTGFWHSSLNNSSEGLYSAYYGQDGLWSFDNGVSNSGTLTSPIVVLDSNPILTFDYALHTEHSSAFGVITQAFPYDRVILQISSDGGISWDDLEDLATTFDPTIFDPVDRLLWLPHSTDLSAYADMSVQVRFYFNTVDGGLNSYEGMYVDRVSFH